MPSITFSYLDLCNLVGEKIPIEQLSKLLEYGKIELNTYDETTDEISVGVGDTNLPYLWSVEGIARLLKGLLGKQKGIPPIEIFKKSEYIINVDQNVKDIRPYIAAFVATGCKVNDHLIKQMIGLQEKLCENYGRRRQKIAVGVYNCDKIAFPITYKATAPESIKFTPLEFKKEMTQQEILEEHPTGKKYALILEGQKNYPILIDKNNSVLSFPPIINSNWSGKINIDDENLFFEATGTDLDSVLLAANIFAQAFYERGFKIYAVDIHYTGSDKVISPFLFNESVKISALQIKNLIGIELNEEQITELLEKMQYEFKNGKVRIPDYRRDIMHPVDIIEDIAIAYGYDNIELLHMKSYTQGNTFPIIPFVNNIRELVIGLGYQEVFSAMLSNKEDIFTKMNSQISDAVELKDFISERFSILRPNILPIMMNVLSQNKHVDYPQRIFEEGIVTTRNNNTITDSHSLALVSAHADSNYTEVRQVLDSIMNSLGIKFSLTAEDNNSFIHGRSASILFNDKKIGIIGEISPSVLSNYGLAVPVSGFEINLDRLFENK